MPSDFTIMLRSDYVIEQRLSQVRCSYCSIHFIAILFMAFLNCHSGHKYNHYLASIILQISKRVIEHTEFHAIANSNIALNIRGAF